MPPARVLARRRAGFAAKECHTISQSTQRITTRFSLVIGAVALTFALLLDQLSKWLVLETLGPDGTREYVTIIPGFLHFNFARNTGSAFGLFQGNSDILKVLALVAVGGLLIFYVRSAARDWLLSLALGLQLGGAMGNIIDRFRHGYVVDFIDLPRFPTFNLADSAITVGVVLLMYALLFRDTTAQGQNEAQQNVEPTHALRDDA